MKQRATQAVVTSVFKHSQVSPKLTPPHHIGPYSSVQGLCGAAGPLGEGGPRRGAAGAGQAGEGAAVYGLPPAHDQRLLGGHSGVPVVLQPATCQQVNQSKQQPLVMHSASHLSIDAVAIAFLCNCLDQGAGP